VKRRRLLDVFHRSNASVYDIYAALAVLSSDQMRVRPVSIEMNHIKFSTGYVDFNAIFHVSYFLFTSLF